MPSSVDIFKENLNPVLIETGSYMGEGIKNALAAGFKKIYSIELSSKYYEYCKNKFKDNDKVVLVHGDSAEVLEDVMSKIDDPITYWLDGHHSGGDTANGLVEFPVLEEIAQIDWMRGDILIIDDIGALEDNGVPRNILENKIKGCFKDTNFVYCKGPKNIVQLIAKRKQDD